MEVNENPSPKWSVNSTGKVNTKKRERENLTQQISKAEDIAVAIVIRVGIE